MRKILQVLVLFTFLNMAGAGASALTFGISIQGDAPNGTRGESYSASFTAVSVHSVTSWNMSGVIPGLRFFGSGYNASLTGTPTAAGVHSVTITARNSNGESATKYCNIVIYEPGESGGGTTTSGDNNGTNSALSISGYFVDNGYPGDEYPKQSNGNVYGQASAQGGTPPYTWSVVSGDLPRGLSLACTDLGYGTSNTYVGPNANLKGILTQSGNYAFRLRVTDSAGASAEKDFTFNVKGDNIDNLTAGEYSYINPVVKWYGSFGPYDAWGGIADRGRSPYKWQVYAGRLPTGLALACSDSLYTSETGSTTGKYAHIKGTPEGNGVFKFVLKLTDADGRSILKEYTMTLASSDAEDPNANGDAILSYDALPAISDDFPSGSVNQPYSATVRAFDGTEPYTWSVSYGDIPGGMSLDCSNSLTASESGSTGRYARLSGTPTVPGYYNFTLKVSDDKGNTAAKAFTVKVSGSTSSGGSNRGNENTTNDQDGSSGNDSTGNGDNGNNGSVGSSGGGGGCKAFGEGMFLAAIGMALSMLKRGK